LLGARVITTHLTKDARRLERATWGLRTTLEVWAALCRVGKDDASRRQGAAEGSRLLDMTANGADSNRAINGIKRAVI
jgi:hypothetical protein